MNTMTAWPSRAMALAALCVAFPAALAQSGYRFPWDESVKRVESARHAAVLGTDALGDRVNLANGSLSFAATDVAIPGNHALAVAFSRTYSVQNQFERISDLMQADWDVDVPRISGVFAPNWHSRVPGDPGRRCSTPIGEATPPSPVWDINLSDFWHGNTLEVGGAASGELLYVKAGATVPSSGGPYFWMTSGQAYVSCLPGIKNGSGEGFFAVTPDGTRYWFDWMAQYLEPHMSSANGGVNIARRKNVLYATKVQDRYGNTVEYQYSNAWNAPGRLTGISASDGRQLSIAYNAYGHVASVTEGARTWHYHYSNAGTRRTLSAVVLPDGSQWTIGFASFTSASLHYPPGHPWEPVRNCFLRLSGPIGPEEVTATIEHPSGLVGSFTVNWSTHGRSNVPVACQNYDWGGTSNMNDDYNWWTINYEIFSLTRKLLSGPGLAAESWTYTYTPNWSFLYYPGATIRVPCPIGVTCGEPICTSDSCAKSSVTTVTSSSGERTSYFHGNSFRYNEGKLLKVERGTDANPQMEVQTFSYDLSMSQQAYPPTFGISLRPNYDGFASEYHRPQLWTQTLRDGVTFQRTHDAFDALARPTRATRSSTSNGHPSRTEQTTYRDNAFLWVLGQVEQVKCVAPIAALPAGCGVTGIVMSETYYDSNWAVPLVSKQFGRTVQTLTWDTTSTVASGQRGTIRTSADGRGNTSTATSWHRGVPRMVTHADGTTRSTEVNASGWVTSTTDENGFKTCYAYDGIGRLSQVTHPSQASPGTCNTSTWNATTLAFERVGSPEYGIEGGHWRHTETRGNRRKITYFDAMWRPRITREFDSGDEANTRTMVLRRYDVNPRKTFESYPQRSIASTHAAPPGVTRSYDGLGRVIEQQADSELGPLVTTTAYQSGLSTRVTNPRGHATTTTYRAFDNPDEAMAVHIAMPEGVNVSIARDVLGDATAITRSGLHGGVNVGVTRSYVYDGHRLLCKTVEPESGATLLSYDGAANVTWRAVGTNLLSLAACDRDSAPANRKIHHAYDTRNRLTATSYGDGSPGVTRSYTPDGLLAGTASNGTAWTYTYNTLRLPVQERLVYGGTTWQIDRAYSANGHASQLTYPGPGTRLVVALSPNALGQPRQLGGYATAVSYHPGGAVAGFTYGNGIAHVRSMNIRMLSLENQDTGVLRDVYAYDRNGNVVGIDDQRTNATPSLDRTLGYDQLDRLKTAAGVWGGATFDYDPLDNIRTATVGNRSSTLGYSSNRMSSVVTNGTTTAYGYDANGNLASRAGQTFSFDIGNRLGASSQGGGYVYDGHGRRVAMSGNDGSTRRYVYGQDGQLLWSTISGGGHAAANTAYLHLQGRQVAEVKYPTGSSTGTPNYVHTDVLGSPVARTNASGGVLGTTQYEPFGRTWSGTNPGPASSIVGFTGHVNDPETGLVYMQQRHYDPIAGRFLSVDPIVTNASDGSFFNRYVYAENNPYRFVDPDGRGPKLFEFSQQPGGPSGGGGGGLGGGVRGGVGVGGAGASGPSPAATRLQANVAQGKAGEAVTREKQGTKIAGEQVTFKTSDGTRTRTDFVTHDKTVIETKTGDSKLTTGQDKLKADIDAGRAVTPVGDNAAKAGLTPGQPTMMKCCEVDRIRGGQ